MSNPVQSAAPDHFHSQTISRLELAILRALCGTNSGNRLADTLRELESHRWSHPEHRVVYQVLATASAISPREWHNELPAQATRMGFPDVEWKMYLGESTDPQQTNLSDLLRELKAETARRP